MDDTQSHSSPGFLSPHEKETQCIICFLTVPVEELTTLPCHHAFHAICLRKWTEYDDHIESRGQCPICRANLRYKCGHIVSSYLLRPGVTILPVELEMPCLSWACHARVQARAAFRRPRSELASARPDQNPA
ncbi:hypothetical protein AAE478_004632 [Parahypoxylon ruwenzoriense]